LDAVNNEEKKFKESKRLKSKGKPTKQRKIGNEIFFKLNTVLEREIK
jgi:hypothetical protein